MKNLSYLLIIFIYMILLDSCSKEYSRSISPENWLIQDQITVKANFQGFIFDINNNPVTGASINAGNKTSLTNEQGVFFIDETSVSLNNAVITISKPGYFTCVKSLRVSEGNDNVIKVQLIPKTLTGEFTSKDGGTVSLESGTSVFIPANGMIDASTAQPYSGKVNVFMHWIDPSNANTLYQMPGELRGINVSGDERMMITYGMVTVELEGDNGQKLQLSKNSEAKLTFNVPAEIQADAPTTIPLWYYDEKLGRWFEEGNAKLINGKYQGFVKHFSTWNCDIPYEQPMIKFCLKVKDEYDIPYANTHILLRRANDKWGGHGYTNGQGILCGMIPANTPLMLEVLGEPGCDQAILTKPIGPYKEDFELDSVVVKRNPEKMITVSGIAVDCNGKLIKDGYVQGQISYRASIGKVINGKFEFSVVRCPSDNQITLFAVDNQTKKVTDRITQRINGNKANVGTLTACTDASKVIFNGLIAYYPLNENANDESGNENHLNQNTVNFTTDLIRGKVADFNGTTWLEKSSALLQSQSGFTFSFWAKSTKNGSMDIMGQFCGNDCNDDIRVQLNAAQCSQSGLSFKSPSHFATAPSNTSDGNWHFYTLTMGESNTYSYSNFKFYIDGIRVGINCGHNWGGWVYNPNVTYQFTIGKGSFLGENFLGSLDDIRIFKRALTELEIKTLAGI